ncbi:MAG: ammonium transporter [Nanoarchaeota archaeon]
MKKGLLAMFIIMSLALVGSVNAKEINNGDVAWVAAASALVMIMTPAVGFFYGGLVHRKHLLSTIIQSIAIFAVVSIIWTLWGYSIAFGPSVNGFFGDLSKVGLNGVGAEPSNNYGSTIPESLFYFFQLMFAAITPALIIGAFAGRIKFSSLMIFVTLWVTFIYAPVAHWVWNADGWLFSLGAIDFAGGTVVHIAAGVSALAAAIFIGRSKDSVSESKPNSVPFVLLGAVLLWFGWFGFNGGSALAANGLAANALVVTNLAAAAAGLSWMGLDWIRKGKPSAVGFAIGVICGLVAITPASGFVSVIPSIIIGFVAGIISNLVANIRVTRTKIDDTLDVFACHGVAGIWGALATGLFASAGINGIDGLFYGNPMQMVYQLIAVVAVALYTFVGSYVLLKLISLFKNIRVSKEEEEKGLDISQHKEEAYS